MKRSLNIRRKDAFHLFLLPWCFTLSLFAWTAGANEYCLRESFNATCVAPDEVLLMTSARYGRMSGGRCIKAEYGHIGCSTEVLSQLDVVCSARQQCVFPVTNLVHHKPGPCPDDVTSFLEATSLCVKASSHHSRCPDSGHVILTAPVGYIALSKNSVSRCPWKISADPFQRIRFTLFSFEQAKTGGATSDNLCPWSLIFEENSPSKGSEHSLCRISARETPVFNSLTNTVTVYVRYRHNVALPVTNLVKYEVTGCPQIKVASNAWVIQDENKATVKCNQTEETWFLACNDFEWKGEIGNCTKIHGADAPKDSIAITSTSTAMPFGFMLAVVIGVLLGIIIGSIPLALVYTCLRRKWNKQVPNSYMRDDIYYPEVEQNLTDDGRSMYPALLKQSPVMTDVDRSKMEQYFYGYTDPYPQMHGPSPIVTDIIAPDVHGDSSDRVMVGDVKNCHQMAAAVGDFCRLQAVECPDVMSQTILSHNGRQQQQQQQTTMESRRLGSKQHVYESASFRRNCSHVGFDVLKKAEIIPMYYKREISLDRVKQISAKGSQSQ